MPPRVLQVRAVIELLEDKDPDEKVGAGGRVGRGGGSPVLRRVGWLAVPPQHLLPPTHLPALPLSPTLSHAQVLIFSEFPLTLKAIKSQLPGIGLGCRDIIGASSAGARGTGSRRSAAGSRPQAAGAARSGAAP